MAPNHQTIQEKFGSRYLTNAPPEVLLEMIESAFQRISKNTIYPLLKQQAQKILKEDHVGKCQSQIKKLIAEVCSASRYAKNILGCRDALHCSWYSDWLDRDDDPENNITIADANVILELDMLYSRVTIINMEMSIQGFTHKCPINTITTLIHEVIQLYPVIPLPFSKKWTFKNDIFRNKYLIPELAEKPSVAQVPVKVEPEVSTKIEPDIPAKTELVKEVSQTMVKILTFSFIDGNIVKVPALISANDLDKIPFAC